MALDLMVVVLHKLSSPTHSVCKSGILELCLTTVAVVWRQRKAVFTVIAVHDL